MVESQDGKAFLGFYRTEVYGSTDVTVTT